MPRFLYFNNRDEFFRIRIEDIVYFEADKNYTVLHLATGQNLVFTLSMQRMQEHLAQSLGDQARGFIRVGKSCIINTAYVFNIDLSKRVLKLNVPGSSTYYPIKVSLEALKKLRELYVR